MILSVDLRLVSVPPLNLLLPCFQIGTITINKDPKGKPQLLASQPGGTYVTLILKQDATPDDPTPPDPRYNHQ